MADNINPNYSYKKQKDLSLKDYVDGILSSNRYILSKAITLLESNREKDYELSGKILEACLPYTGKSMRIGISGVPGVGKSTFIEAFGMLLINQFKRKPAILTIDPSSSKSGGSILGDKTRMEKLAANSSAYIRPSASSGNLGGVALRSRETILLCEAAGFDTILVETVGVGQSESQVHSMVDFFLLLMLVGAGDELQGYKRGIMEMADAFIITKADSDNKTKAIHFQKELEQAIHFLPVHENNWLTKVFLSSALKSEGLEEIWEDIKLFYKDQGSWINKNRKRQKTQWFNDNNEHLIKQALVQKSEALLKKLYQDIEEDRISVRTASSELLKNFIHQ